MRETAHHNSWGLVFGPKQSVHRFLDRTAALPNTATSLLPYGNGRSYGDSCLNDGGSLIDCRSLSRFIAFDEQSGVLRCEAGVMLSHIIDLVLPRGWFLPVTPGTKFVTVGGAIANDVHGKNHHVNGSFGHHVVRFELLRSDGTRVECSRSEHSDGYFATIGGLGLTGLITWAEVRLKPVKGSAIIQRTHRFNHLNEFFELSERLGGRHEYAVAWIDCVANGPRLGRGLFFLGDHDEDPAPVDSKTNTANVALSPPFSLINGASLRIFNSVYFGKGRHFGVADRVHFDRFFYPLDRIQNWNRIYGPHGFMQYQCVVPKSDDGRKALLDIVQRIAASGQGSFLAVLKEFGDMPQAGMMSFPRHGYTLALDFPNKGSALRELLAALDVRVAEVGGRVYPAKDARMSAASFAVFYPQWQTFAAHRDPRFSSSFWRRVTEPASSAALAA